MLKLQTLSDLQSHTVFYRRKMSFCLNLRRQTWRKRLFGRFCGNPEIDRLVEKGRAETTPAVRHSLYRQIEDTIVREVLMLPLFHEQAYRFARPEVEGLAVSFGWPTVAYEQLRVRR